MERGRHYLFFALRPAAEAAERLCGLAADLRKRCRMTGRPVAPDRLHISLNFVADLAAPDPQVVDRASAAVAGVAFPAFAVALDRMVTWGRGEGARPIVMRSDDGLLGVEGLHRTLHGALAQAGLAPRRERAFEPHLTLLRDKAVVPLEFVDTVAWTAREFVLLNSVRGEGRHEVLGRWPLGGS